MLLESAVERDSPSYFDSDNRTDPWQDFLNDQATNHAFFRRRAIALCGGKGRVVLMGKVPSYYEKQLAQEFVRRFDGVEQIDNRLEVCYADRDN